MSSAICFNLDQSKILLSVNGLSGEGVSTSQDCVVMHSYLTKQQNYRPV